MSRFFSLCNVYLKQWVFLYASLYLHNSLNSEVLVLQMHPLFFSVQLSELLN